MRLVLQLRNGKTESKSLSGTCSSDYTQIPSSFEEQPCISQAQTVQVAWDISEQGPFNRNICLRQLTERQTIFDAHSSSSCLFCGCFHILTWLLKHPRSHSLNPNVILGTNRNGHIEEICVYISPKLGPTGYHELWFLDLHAAKRICLKGLPAHPPTFFFFSFFNFYPCWKHCLQFSRFCLNLPLSSLYFHPNADFVF